MTLPNPQAHLTKEFVQKALSQDIGYRGSSCALLDHLGVTMNMARTNVTAFRKQFNMGMREHFTEPDILNDDAFRWRLIDLTYELNRLGGYTASLQLDPHFRVKGEPNQLDCERVAEGLAVIYALLKDSSDFKEPLRKLYEDALHFGSVPVLDPQAYAEKIRKEIIPVEEFRGAGSKLSYKGGDGAVGLFNHLGSLFGTCQAELPPAAMQRNMHIKREHAAHLAEMGEIASGFTALYNETLQLDRDMPTCGDEIYLMPHKSGFRREPLRKLCIRAYDFLSDKNESKIPLKQLFENLGLGDIEQEAAKSQNAVGR